MDDTGGKTNFDKILLSPPVLIGGVALGAIILLMNAGSAGASAGGPAADPAVLNANVAMNNTAAQEQVQLASIAAQSGANTQDVNLQSQGQILGFLTNLSNNNALVDQTFITSNAGVTQSQIASATSIALDVNNNLNRLQMGYIQAQISADQAQAQVNIATIQANAATKIARSNAIASTITGVGRIVTAPFTGGLSLLGGGGFGGGGYGTPGTGPGVGFGSGGSQLSFNPGATNYFPG